MNLLSKGALIATALMASAADAQAQGVVDAGAQGAETGVGRVAPGAASSSRQGAGASKAGARSRPAGRKSRLTTSDTAMSTGATGGGAAPTGPNTSTPDTEGTSDLTGSTGPSIPLSAAPAPYTPAPPGGAPSGGSGPNSL